jgi:hypothetical protein
MKQTEDYSILHKTGALLTLIVSIFIDYLYTHPGRFIRQNSHDNLRGYRIHGEPYLLPSTQTKTQD